MTTMKLLFVLPLLLTIPTASATSTGALLSAQTKFGDFIDHSRDWAADKMFGWSVVVPSGRPGKVDTHHHFVTDSFAQGEF